MGKLKPSALGEVSGSVGGVTFQKSIFGTIAKSKITEQTAEPTAEQITQRKAFGRLQQYAAMIRSLINTTYREAAKAAKKYPGNLFSTDNKGIVDAATGKIDTSKFASLSVSRGPLEQVRGLDVKAIASANIQISWATSGYLPGVSNSTGIYFAFYNVNKDYIYISGGGLTLGSGPITQSGIGEVGDIIHTYGVLVNPISGKASNTSYGGSITLTA